MTLNTQAGADQFPARSLARSLRGKAWAVLIGISTYQNSSLDLSFADRDAKMMKEFLMSPAAGSIPADHICDLINEKATYANVRRALRTFLKRPAAEDLVIIFLACHGAPDADRPNVLYLLTHDTDPTDIAGTAMPMREIDDTLRENLLATKVVIFADTCHSAGIGGPSGRRSAANEAQVINRFFAELSEAKGGVALLTSAESNESAQESVDYEHGVFTHFLLRGLSGEADGFSNAPRDGVVTVDELFHYVQKQVQEATMGGQHPAIGPMIFDKNLVLSVSADLNLKEHLRMGRTLLDIARVTNEPARFQAAANLFAEALQTRLAGTIHLESEIGFGLCLVNIDRQAGIEVLSQLAQNEFPDRDVLLELGVAYARSENIPAAISTFSRFATEFPDDEYAAWAAEYAGWLAHSGPVRKRALLIGVDDYQMSTIDKLAGCVNDVRIIQGIVQDRFGFQHEDVITVLNEKATLANVRRAFKQLAAKSQPGDVVVVHYSGHSVTDSMRPGLAARSREAYLILHDTHIEGSEARRSMTFTELDDWMRKIPAGQRTLILDTHPSVGLVDKAGATDDYVLILASDSAEIAYESSSEIDGVKQPTGLFTSALKHSIEAMRTNSIPLGPLIDRVMTRIKEMAVEQRPVLIGDRAQRLFDREDYLLGLYDLSRLGSFDMIGSALIARRRGQARRLGARFGPGRLAMARAMLDRQDWDAARELAALAEGDGGVAGARALLVQARLLLRLRQDKEARDCIRRFCRHPLSETSSQAVAELSEAAELLGSSAPWALLVAIGRYKVCSEVEGAHNDLDTVRKAIITDWGFPPDHVVVLVDADATRQNVLDEFKRLVARSRSEPALFYFSGNGSSDVEGQPVLVSADGRTEGVFDITISELANLAANSENLVSVIDAGFIRLPEPTPHTRTVEPDKRRRLVGARDLDKGVTSTSAVRVLSSAEIGFLTIYERESILSATTTSTDYELEREIEDGYGRRIVGNLTYGLFGASIPQVSATYADLVDRVGTAIATSETTVLEPAFVNRTQRRLLHDLIDEIELAEVDEAILLLTRTIEERSRRGERFPAGYVELGVAHGLRKRHDLAVSALSKGVAMIQEMIEEGHTEARALESEARYQLGKALYERGNDYTRAVGELNMSLNLNNDNIGVCYYLGQAIRQMVELETLARAETVFQRYLEHGAPLGHEDEVRGFLQARVAERP